MKTTGQAKLIKQGYADVFSDAPEAYNDRCLQFRVTIQDQQQACDAVRLIKEYNEFKGAKVAAKLAEVWNRILKFALQLQHIHDLHEPNVWKDCLLVFGEAYGLHTELVWGYDKIS